jgi:hypothetical protein
MEVKFGTQIQVIASPQALLNLSDLLEKWLIRIAESGDQEIDLEREALGTATAIIAMLAEMEQRRNKDNQ